MNLYNPLKVVHRFNSKLVRLEVKAKTDSSKQQKMRFNSKLVRLEGKPILVPRIPVRPRFNSKLVRLEGLDQLEENIIIALFQFQIGAIRSGIKRFNNSQDTGFNSKLVRLEV